jgi:hypothetical protein
MHQVGRSLFHLHVVFPTLVPPPALAKSPMHLCMDLLVVSPQYENISLPVSPWNIFELLFYPGHSYYSLQMWQFHYQSLRSIEPLEHI